MKDVIPLEEQVIAALRRITRAIDLHSRLLLQENGLTVPQLAALQVIQRMQPVNVGVLARHIHLGAATVTGILGRLESRGLVSRARGHCDRRSVEIHLTEEGKHLLAKAPSLLQDRFRRKLGELEDWEQAMVLATLQRIAAMMDAEDIEATSVVEDIGVSVVPEGIVAQGVAHYVDEGDKEAVMRSSKGSLLNASENELLGSEGE